MLIGVKDDGMPVGMGDVNRGDWDGAYLQDIVRPYVEGQIRIMSQIHALDQGAVVLLYIAAHGDGFPVPFSKQGEYTPKGDKRQKGCSTSVSCSSARAPRTFLCDMRTGLFSLKGMTR